MAHEHSVIDRDTAFVVDAETMKISCVSEVKSLRRGDHGAERYSFSMPRYIEGHDMALCNTVEVHYDNINYDPKTRETTTNSSFDSVDDFGVSETDENTVVWSWLVKGDATQLSGTLVFCIRFACLKEEMIEYQKFTEPFESIPVGDSIYNAEAITKEYPDVVQAAINSALEQAKESGEFDGEPGKDGNDGQDGYTPQKGIDYCTEEDKNEIVDAVLGAMPAWEGGSY